MLGCSPRFCCENEKLAAHSYFIHSGRKHKCEKNLNNENSKKAPRKKKKKKENDILSLCGKRKLYLTTDLDLLQNIFIKKTSAKQKVAFFLRANRFSKKSENIFSLVIKRLPRFNFFPSESGGRPRQLWAIKQISRKQAEEQQERKFIFEELLDFLRKEKSLCWVETHSRSVRNVRLLLVWDFFSSLILLSSSFKSLESSVQFFFFWTLCSRTLSFCVVCSCIAQLSHLLSDNQSYWTEQAWKRLTARYQKRKTLCILHRTHMEIYLLGR